MSIVRVSHRLAVAILILGAVAVPPALGSRAEAASPAGARTALAIHAPQESAVIEAGSSVVVRGDGDCLRVRAAPSITAEVLTCLADGSQALVLAGPVTADAHSWLQIEASSTIGWAAGEYLELVATAPEPEAPPVTEEAPATPVSATDRPRADDGLDAVGDRPHLGRGRPRGLGRQPG